MTEPVETLDCPVIAIPAEDWDKFMDWVIGPPWDNAALRELPGRRPEWQNS